MLRARTSFYACGGSKLLPSATTSLRIVCLTTLTGGHRPVPDSSKKQVEPRWVPSRRPPHGIRILRRCSGFAGRRLLLGTSPCQWIVPPPMPRMVQAGRHREVLLLCRPVLVTLNFLVAALLCSRWAIKKSDTVLVNFLNASVQSGNRHHAQRPQTYKN